MKEIYINLKTLLKCRVRWADCGPVDNPVDWIRSVIEESLEMGLGQQPQTFGWSYLLPESLLPTGSPPRWGAASTEQGQMLELGCQGVHWDNISVGGKLWAAFTSVLPARSAKSTWLYLGRSSGPLRGAPI